jgi:hypothetical protein
MTTQNPAQRIKGQEVTVLISDNGVLQDTLTDIQNFEMELQFEIISKGYLGEPSNRKDEIYNGAKFTMELHLHTEDWFNFQSDIKARAQRVQPDLIFNITAVLSFPNGDTPTVLLPDCKFGAQPMSIRSRGDYVSVKLEGEVGDYTPALS